MDFLDNWPYQYLPIKEKQIDMSLSPVEKTKRNQIQKLQILMAPQD